MFKKLLGVPGMLKDAAAQLRQLLGAPTAKALIDEQVEDLEVRSVRVLDRSVDHGKVMIEHAEARGKVVVEHAAVQAKDVVDHTAMRLDEALVKIEFLDEATARFERASQLLNGVGRHLKQAAIGVALIWGSVVLITTAMEGSKTAAPVEISAVAQP